MSQVSEQIRQQFGEADDRRDAGLTIPSSIKSYRDISYGADKTWQILDIYRPKNAQGNLPVLVVVHGGGWVYGDKERYQYYAADMAARGFAVVCYTYRLAPDFQFPAPLEDTNLVFDWIMKNAGAYDLDTDHIFAAGDSAGAHILGLYSNILTNPSYASQFDFTAPANVKLQAVALNCGAYKIEISKTDQVDLTQLLMADFLPDKGSEKELDQINVLNYINTNFPPSFITTAVEDFLQHDAPLLVQKLTEVEVPFAYYKYGDKINRLQHVFHLNIRNPHAILCNDSTAAFFKGFLKNE